MKKELHILFTGVGRRVELIQAFRNASEKLNIKLIVYGADLTETAPALYYCNMQVKVPRINDENYIPFLYDFCQKEKIDALIPTIDTDLVILSKNKEKFNKIGTTIFVSDYEITRACADKKETAEIFYSCGLKTPSVVDDYAKYNGGFPAFIKPKNGSSAINTFKINCLEELIEYASRVPDYIIQPFINGTEYSVDVFCDLQGNMILMTTRKRLQMRTGEVIKTQVVHDNKVEDEIKALVSKYKFNGQISVQFIRDEKNNDDFFIEINARFGGGSPLSIMAGADSSEMLIRLLCGENLEYERFSAKENMYFSRFDQCVLIPNKDYKRDIKAIVFDLDDTLYPEIDYLKSGLKSVAKILPNVENCYEKMLDAYERKFPIFDYVLKEENIYSEELKDRCLFEYRNHTPNIHLYSEVEDTIKKLKNLGIKLGLITDGRIDGQRKKIQALGLEKYFDEIIITDEIGGEMFRKPCDISFRIIQRKFGVPFEQMAYVGDNLSKDFIAPIELNMMPVYIDREDKIYNFDNIPDYILRISSIDELLEKI